jgi:hypothetical protein
VVNEWTRVVVFDETHRTVVWVAAAADSFTLLSGQKNVLVDLVGDSEEITMVRMPIPEAAP